MGTETLQWVPQALLLGKPLGSPLFSVEKLAEHAAELTPRGEELVNDSLRTLLLPIPLPSLMDRDEAKFCLNHVAEKVVTRAAKKRAKAAAAAAAKDAKRRNLGEARRAWRENIAQRLPTSKRVAYDTTGKRVS